MSVRIKRVLILSGGLGWLLASQLSIALCPDLGSFYQRLGAADEAVSRDLSTLLDECYSNSEYFALLGAVQLNMDDLFSALENLERSLLLDPNNGSAAMDYAEILYRQGQVTSALEMNELLAARDDLPEGLYQVIRQRARRWSRSAVSLSAGFGIAAGYDNNLNSAPLGEQLTLTLSGRPVSLEVSPEFRANSGEYSSALGGFTRSREGVKFRSRVSGSFRGRFGNSAKYEMLQGSALYTLSETSENPRWNTFFGLDHLNFGRNSIFSSSTLKAVYRLAGLNNCSVYAAIAAQYQHFHKQVSLSGIESSAGSELDCRLPESPVLQRFGVALSALKNGATRSDRLGEDRAGWRLNLAAQRPLGRGRLQMQFTHTKLDDETGYSSIFSDGAKRQESLNSVYVRYLLPLSRLGRSAQLSASVYYNSQRSTIELFRTRGTSAEIGINWGI